jgi:hypothetical protein
VPPGVLAGLRASGLEAPAAASVEGASPEPAVAAEEVTICGAVAGCTTPEVLRATKGGSRRPARCSGGTTSLIGVEDGAAGPLFCIGCTGTLGRGAS